MFIDVDYSRKLQEAKLHLAKPNKQVISNISEKFSDSVSLKLGNISELSFSIPHYIDEEKNKHTDLIKEKMLIRLTMGAYKEWYVVDEIEEDGEDSDIFNVKAFSLGYELKRKRVLSFEEEHVNATQALTTLLQNTVWSIGSIDPVFDAMIRSFEINKSNVLKSIIQASEAYGALIVWNTLERKVSFVNMKENGRFRGMTVNYGRFLRSIKRTRTTDELVTRLYIYGSEDMTIHSVNPTGMGYVENFDYFMYPFERDVDKNTIQSSHFMSDELCHAILDHNIAVEEKSPTIKTLQDENFDREVLLDSKKSELSQLELELDTILALLDTAQASGDEALISQRKQERDDKQAEIQSKKVEITNLETEIANTNAQIESLQDEISKESNFTLELLDELNLYIHEGEWRDDRYTDVKELYDDGIVKFEEMRQPKVVIDVTIDNLLNIIEEQYYWDKLVIGDLIKVKYPQMNIEYMAKIIEINYDLEAGEASIIIANTSELLDDMEKLQQILHSNSSASSLVQNNKYKWDKVNAVAKEVSAIVSQEWDANKNKITAGVNNTIEVGNRGIIIKNPDFPDEVVIMQSGIIALSKDGGETWKTAIKPDGIVAERLIGQIIAGQNLLITNSSGSFTFDNNGVRISASAFVVESGSGANLVNRWENSSNFFESFEDDGMITPYEKKRLKEEWNNLKTRYDSTVTQLDTYYSDGGDSIADVSTYKNNYTALYDYLFVTLQTDGYALLNDSNLGNTTAIDKATYDLKFNNFRNSQVKVDEIIQIKAKSLSDDAQQRISEVEDDIVYKIELHSSNGLTFKNNIINTTITAKVYRGKDDITATLSNSAFIWRKYDKNGTEDTAWYNDNIGIGNIIDVTELDIAEKATFKCDVEITT